MTVQRSDATWLDCYGSDFLQFFAEVAATSTDPVLRSRARSDARRLAFTCLEHFRKPGALRSPELVVEAASTVAISSRLGFHSATRALRAGVRERLGDYAEEEIFGLNVGQRCADPELLCDLVIRVYFLHQAGLVSPELLEWTLRQVADYEYVHEVDRMTLADQGYLATHVIYALSMYGLHRLEPERFLPEQRFLRASLPRYLQEVDVELLGEAIETLLILGTAEDDDPLVREGIALLLSLQREDGSWGWPTDDYYTRYHSTWTSLGALRRVEHLPSKVLWPEWNALRCSRGRSPE